MAMLQTPYADLGPVSFRKRRPPLVIKLDRGWYGNQAKGSVPIRKEWLKAPHGQGGGGKHKAAAADEANSKLCYRAHVKQAMLIAKTDMERVDVVARRKLWSGPLAGQLLDDGMMEEALKELDTQRRLWAEGGAMVPVPSAAMSTMQNRSKTGPPLNRLVKRTRHTFQPVVRFFRIETGRLKVYRHPPHEIDNIVVAKYGKVQTYELADAEVCLERSDMPQFASTEPFYLQGEAANAVIYRVRVTLRERSSGPVFLYTEDAREARNWERAVRMSKYMSTPGDQEAMRMVVSRVASVSRVKAWQALFGYFREVSETRQLVRRLGHRLMRAEMSKGWMKMRMLYLQTVTKESLRQQQIGWVNSLLRERLDSMATKAVADPMSQRRDMVSKLQTRFRRYRTDRIVDRTYPLGSMGLAMTRMQQAQSGMTMAAALDAVSTNRVMKLVYDGWDIQCQAKLEAEPTFFETKSPLYSSISLPLRFSSVQVSEGFSMLSLMQVDELSELSHLAKGSWAHFVSLSSISSVVLHTERVLRKDAKSGKQLHPGLCQGAWFTINGPRIGWGRHLREAKNRTLRKREQVAGTPDGARMGRVMSLGLRTEWLRLSIRIEPSILPEQEEDDDDDACPPCDRTKGGRIGEDVLDVDGDLTDPLGTSSKEENRQTFMVMHCLGRRFESQCVLGSVVSYFNETCEVSVPVSEDFESLSALDNNEINVEICELRPDMKAPLGTRQRERGASKTLWAGSMPLWKLFCASDEDTGLFSMGDSNAETRTAVDGDAPIRETRKSTGGVPPAPPTSLRTTIGDSNVTTSSGPRAFEMVPPLLAEGIQSGTSNMVIEIEAVATFEKYRNTSAVSPELQGRGNIAALYTTHRGAWFDPKSGENKSFASAAPSFLELCVGSLRFPEGDVFDQNRIFKFHIEASINGTTVASPPLTRSKKVWSRVVHADPDSLDFAHVPLYIPIPPGAWASAERRPKVEISVVRTVLQEALLSYDDLLRQEHGNDAEPSEMRDVAWKSILLLEGLHVDKAKTGIRVPMCDVGLMPPEVSVLRTPPTVPKGGVVTEVSVTLRDRDYVRLRAPKDKARHEVLCVGEKASLQVEAPIMPPRTELEHRRRCFPGEFRGPGGSAGQHALPLREPRMSHEWASSGLDKLPDPPAFRPKNIPLAAEDILPHKYVLPPSEMQFIQEHRPGVYWRIIERLVGNSIREKKKEVSMKGGAYFPVIVEELTHMMTQIPSTVLAVYPNHTCDLELDEHFMREWSKNPDKCYSLPGVVIIHSFKPSAKSVLRLADQGAGDVTSFKRMRFLLKHVPLGSVTSMQATGFNIYDADFKDVEDAVKQSPCDISDDWDPRAPGITWEEPSSSRKPLGGYAIRAGPLPIDAGPVCQYEWSLHFCAQSEDEMYRFVSNLRQGVRLDLDEQIKKLDEFCAKTAQSQMFSSATAKAIEAQDGLMKSGQMGHLEVVLAEAKHLGPQYLVPDRSVSQTVSRLVAAEPSVSVQFRLTDEGRGEDLVFRGSKAQYSPQIKGDSPSWASLPELATAGGWTFKTPVIDPGRYPFLGMELTLLQHGNPKRPLYTVRIPITGGREGIRFNIGESWRCAEILESRGEGMILSLPETSRSSSCRTSHRIRCLDDEPICSDQDWVIFDEDSKRLFLSLGHAQRDEGYDYTEVSYAASPGIDQNTKLCVGFPESRFHNLWLPLSKPEGTDASRTSVVAGEVHILCLWVPSRPTAQEMREPSTARGWRTHVLRPKLHLPEDRLREETFDMQVRMNGYDPNLAGPGDFPKSRSEALAEQWDHIADSTPYLKCLDQKSEVEWFSFFEELDRSEIRLGSLSNLRRNSDSKVPPDTALRLTELMRGGVPAVWRRHIWFEILHADILRDCVNEEFKARGGGPVFSARSNISQEQVSDSFRKLLELGFPLRSEAMLQLQEDFVSASIWETCPGPPTDLHLAVLTRAQNVCVAVIAFNQDPSLSEVLHFSAINWDSGPMSKVMYSESLLVLAFFLLIAQSAEPVDKGHYKSRNSQTSFSSSTGPRGARSRSSNQHVAAQEELDEERAFWMLCALTQLPAFQDYFASPKPYDSAMDVRSLPQMPMVKDFAPMCSRPGPMEDIYRLDLCLARYERELWVHMQALGFQLCSVFHSAFSRFYAFLLPPASLFRLWDLLFDDATDHTAVDQSIQKAMNSGKSLQDITGAAAAAEQRHPPRRALIDLAFGMLRKIRSELLKCQSALEVRHCIIRSLENMWDPAALVAMVTEVERFLWVEGPFQVMSLHTNDYEQLQPLWNLHFAQYRQQNMVLREIVQSIKVDLEAFFANRVHVSPMADRRITTRNLVSIVVPQLQKALCSSNTATQHSVFGGMLRPTLERLRKVGPELETDIMGRVSNFLAWTIEKAMLAAHIPQEQIPVPASIPRPPGSFGEPSSLERTEFQSAVSKGLGSEWGVGCSRLWDAFCSPLERRASLNEMIAALICSSRGTVGEKAVALFHMYAGHQKPNHVAHINPVTHAARTVLSRIEGASKQQDVAGEFAPAETDIPKMALHFRIFTHASRGRVLIGEVFVPSLNPFIMEGLGNEPSEAFPIWGPPSKAPWGGGRQAMTTSDNVRPFRGLMHMSITWTPSNGEIPSVGQLGVNLVGIEFNNRIEDPESKNPFVSLVTYTDRGEEVQIPRWDPRTAGMVISSIPAGLILGDAFGEFIEFPETMMKVFGKCHHLPMGRNHGWDQYERKWMWDRRIGDQYSVEDFQMRNAVCVGAQQKGGPNTISIKACRILTEGILMRGLHCLTNRQATLLSDQIFNRAGAVPGVLEAILVRMEWEDGALAKHENISLLKEDAAAKKIPFTDIKQNIILAHEDFISGRPGNINLFSFALQREIGGKTTVAQQLNCAAPPMQPRFEDAEGDLGKVEGTMNLSSLHVRDPYPGSRKVLLIRFVRGGDGQRMNAQYQVDELGAFRPQELKMDMDQDDQNARIQNSLSKAEFVSCILSNTLLSEALRGMGLFDMSTHDSPSHTHGHLMGAIKLEVAVSDPMQERADDEMMDAMSVCQKVLLEVYDSDRGKDDYLGECFLPPFDSMSETPKRFVLDIRNPSDRTRPDDRYKGALEGDATGTLFVEASWHFPLDEAEEVVEKKASKAAVSKQASAGDESLDERAKDEKRKHSGKLRIRILKAEGLREGDVTFTGRTRCDPYIAAYIQNETFESVHPSSLPPGIGKFGWRVDMGGLKHETAFRTKVAKGQEPVWNESFEIELQTGHFEKRTKQQFHLDLTRTAARRHKNERLVAALRDATELDFSFSDGQASPRSGGIGSARSSGGPDPGGRHGVRVYLGDTIFQFKIKLQEASRREAMYEADNLQRLLGRGLQDKDEQIIQARTRLGRYEALAANINYTHVVMVFVPSGQLRDLYRSGRVDSTAYEHLYMVEFADPSSWQPLDPVRSFMHYASQYGFGAINADAQHIKVVEGNENYSEKNNRYRKFLQEEKKWRSRIEEVNKSDECYGYARYTHKRDGGSTEWRPVIAERVLDPAVEAEVGGGGGGRVFNVTYMHTPAAVDGRKGATPTETGTKVSVAGSKVLLAPHRAKILGSGNLEHTHLLKQAVALQETGLSETDILSQLNGQLMQLREEQRNQQESAGLPTSSMPVPLLTIQDVRAALRGIV